MKAGGSREPTFGQEIEGGSPSSCSVVVDFRSGEAVVRHPELRPYLDDGWSVRSAVPHVVDADEVRLLVVMIRGAATEQSLARE